MIPIAFDEANIVLDKPDGVDYDICEPLNVLAGAVIDGDGEACPMMISCWKLTAEELEEIIRTKRVWLKVAGVSHPMVLLSGTKPFEMNQEMEGG